MTQIVYVAVVETHDEIIAIADNAGDAVKFASRKALSYLQDRGATFGRNTPEKIAEYFGITAVAVPLNTAVFLRG